MPQVTLRTREEQLFALNYKFTIQVTLKSLIFRHTWSKIRNIANNSYLLTICPDTWSIIIKHCKYLHIVTDLYRYLDYNIKILQITIYQ